MGFRQFIRPAAKALRRIVIGNCALHLAHNHLGKFNLLKENIETGSGMAHTCFTVAESIDYIDHVFTQYKLEAGVNSFMDEPQRSVRAATVVLV